MSAVPVIENCILTPQEETIVELEQHLIGWQLKGAPGVQEVIAAELRNDATQFQPPYNRVQQAIFRELDGGRTVSVRTIYASLHDNAGLKEIGGAEHLWTLAHASPAIVSPEDGRKKAMEHIRAWRHLQSPLPKSGDIELVSADSVTPASIDWIWPGWLAAGKFHLIAGSPGTGKTTLSLSLASVITTGASFPCGWQPSRGSVLMWTGEDDLADSIVPRFMACGGDRSRLHFVGGIRDENGGTFPFDPALDMEPLTARARTIRDLRLLIVDPVVSAVSGDSHKNSETRRSLQPLVDFAAQAGVAVLGVTHYSKGTAGRDPAERVTGSLAFVAVSRLVMATAKPKQFGDSWRLVRAKSNIGPDGGGFEYDLQRVTIDSSRDIQGQCVTWGASLEGTAQTLLAEVESPEPDAPSREAAEVWLADMLGTGTVRAAFIESTAREAGHTPATLRRAKKRLGVETVKLGFDGGWGWQMPKMLKAREDAQTQNGERLRAFEDAQGVSAFEDVEDAHQNGVSTLGGIVSTLGDGGAPQ